MEFAYTLTELEMVKAMKLHGRGSKKVQLSVVALGVLLILLSVFTDYKLYPILFVTGGVLGFLITYFWVIPHQAKKQYRELKSIQSEIKLEFDEKGMRVYSTTGSSDLDWSHFKKWKYDGSILVMYITSRMFYMLPLRALKDSSQVDELLSLLRRNLGKNV